MPAPRVTPDLIRRYIEEGRGQGHGEDYRAFIQLKRWNASPVSVQTLGRVPPFRRDCHFLSRSEWLLALLLSWAGCHVREQVPMWPWRHPSPAYGLDRDPDGHLPWSVGTIELCRAASIKHGCFIGTRIPYIWTLDLVATHAWATPGSVSMTVVSVKPLRDERYSGDIDPIARGPEKLEIERRYAQELGLRYFVGDRTLYPSALLGQLEIFSSSATLCPNSATARARDALLDRRGGELSQLPPEEWLQLARTDLGLDEAQAINLVHHILWHQLVDADLSRELHFDDCVPPGGLKHRDALRRMLEEARS